MKNELYSHPLRLDVALAHLRLDYCVAMVRFFQFSWDGDHERAARASHEAGVLIAAYREWTGGKDTHLDALEELRNDVPIVGQMIERAPLTMPGFRDGGLFLWEDTATSPFPSRRP